MSTFLRNAWYVAAWDYEIKQGELLARTVIGEPVVLYRTAGGTCVALEDRCCHRHAPLSLGRCEGNDVRCMYHGMRFDPTGKCVEIPGQPRIPESYRVLNYRVVERHRWIWVWMGDPAKADPKLIPAATALELPGYSINTGQMLYAANYQLLNDNLLDFSHVSYLHATSLGASEEWAHTRPKITRLSRGVRVERWLPDQPALPDMTTKDPVDFWNAYDYMVPGVLLMSSVLAPAGTAKKLNFAPPDESVEAFSGGGIACQAVTPCTADSTRYFYATGVAAKNDTEEFADKNFRSAEMAFEEDKRMIEAQHATIRMSPHSKMLATSFDGALRQFRTVFEELIEQEGKPA